MTQGEVLIQYSWLIALIVSVGVISWTSLLLQAVFQDKRIALVGVFGSLLVAYPAVFPDLVPITLIFKLFAALINIIFILWFLLKNYNKVAVYLPVIGMLFSVGTGYWLYQTYQTAA